MLLFYFFLLLLYTSLKGLFAWCIVLGYIGSVIVIVELLFALSLCMHSFNAFRAPELMIRSGSEMFIKFKALSYIYIYIVNNL